MKLDEKFWDEIDSKKKREIQAICDSEFERLSNYISNSIMEIMAQENISPAEVSRRLDTSRASVTNIIKPGRNMTLQTLIKFVRVLGYRVNISFERLDKRKGIKS